VKIGVQGVYKLLKLLDSGACPGLDPGFAGMTRKGIFGFEEKDPPSEEGSFS
jgi:hypothetical protein